MKPRARWSWRRGLIICSPPKATSPQSKKTSRNWFPRPTRISPPHEPTSTQFRTLGINRSRIESRSIRSQPVCAEPIGFPLVAQAARLVRQTTGRKDEQICLLTDAEPEELDAQKWLELNRAGIGGIENGLHQRLDISHNDDRCRIRSSKGIWVMGMFRRLANSLFSTKPRHGPHFPAS